MFNQVAIVAFKIFGTPMGTYESYALHGREGPMATKVIGDTPVEGHNQTIVPRNLKIETVETNKMDRDIVEKIEMLQSYKMDALHIEDFDRCKLLKSLIDKLKIVGN